MTTKNYQWILYAITATIVITIGVQIYWNYNNYQLNKQRVSNEIQLSIDNALEEYYAEIAKSDFLTIIKSDKTIGLGSSISEGISKLENTLPDANKVKSINIASLNFDPNSSNKTDSILSKEKLEINKNLISQRKKSIDSIFAITQLTTNDSGLHIERGKEVKAVQVLKGKKAFDSLKIVKSLNTILISIDRDTLEYSQVDSLLKIQFNQKHISPNYSIKHFKDDTLHYTLNSNLKGDKLMSVTSKSTYLKPKEQVVLEFENPMKDTLKLGFTGILTSFLLAAAIISCLFYLLHIIKQQKQLAEIKNDLISNITHEFKTPISTIGVAIESLKNFNALDDKIKTQNYLDISNNQLGKLNVMVEKLLETATLDSDTLELSKEHINVTDLIKHLVARYDLQKEQKTIDFKHGSTDIFVNADSFHIENTINNMIDNAIKYGGDKIIIELDQNALATIISISDTGNSLKQINKERLFEKFYRVPKGNTHDIKGFGIGLYYTKKIIEKHGGTVSLNLDNQLTTFKISLPNE